MAKGVIVRDLGYIKVLQNLAELDGQVVLVGLHADGTAQDGTLVAHYGAINEFGSARIPERSFMRSTFDRDVKKLTLLRERLVRGVIDRKLAPRQASRLLGERHEQDIKATIASHPPPPNSPKTVARKKSSGTLVDTGLLRNTIRYEVQNGPSSDLFGLLSRVRAKMRGR